VLVHGANGDLDTFALIEGLLAERRAEWVCWMEAWSIMRRFLPPARGTCY
jgi:hypothetical protein